MLTILKMTKNSFPISLYITLKKISYPPLMSQKQQQRVTKQPLLNYETTQRWGEALLQYRDVAIVYFDDSWKSLGNNLFELCQSLCPFTAMKIHPASLWDEMIQMSMFSPEEQHINRANDLLSLLETDILPKLLHGGSLSHPTMDRIRKDVIHTVSHMTRELYMMISFAKEGAVCSSSPLSNSLVQINKWASLPSELLNKIFFDVSINQRLLLRRVCVSWKEILVPSLNSIHWFPSSRPSVLCQANHLGKVFQNNISEVTLSWCEPQVEREALSHLCRDACETLQKVCVTSLSFDHLICLNRISSLHSLWVCGERGKYGTVTREMFDTLCLMSPPTMRELHISLCDDVTGFPDHFTRLSGLDVLEISSLTSAHFRAPSEMSCFNKLVTFSVRFRRAMIQSSQWSDTFRSIRNLSSLRLVCRQVTGKMTFRFPKSLVTLYLQISSGTTCIIRSFKSVTLSKA